jgi:cation transport regulator ChaC
MSQKVFAFGSNMCSGRFRHYRMHPEGEGRAALLSEYRLLFNKKSNDGSGKANAELHPGGQVRGVLYAIPDADLKTLDDGEKGYYRTKLPVSTTDSSITEAWVYLASEPSNDSALRPYTWYKRFLVEGARQHALLPEYIAKLEQIEATQDPNHKRDRKMRAIACRAAS